MTTKFKILSAISFIALAMALTFVGVWALADLNFTVGGNIEYTAPEPQSGYTVSLYFVDGVPGDVEYSVNGGEYTPISGGMIEISSVETISFKKLASVSLQYRLRVNLGEKIYITAENPITITISADTTIHVQSD